MTPRKLAVVAVVCSLIAACGSDGNNGQPNNAPSSNNTTASNNTNNTVAQNSNNGSVLPMGFVALGATSDFTASAYSAFTGQTDDETTFGTGDISVAVGAEWAFVLDRSGGQVQVLGPSFEDMGIIDVAGGGAANPNDAIDVMGKVYVSLYDAGELVVSEVTEGSPNTWSVDRVELAVFDDYDQNPEPSAMASDGQYLLVVLQRLQD